MTLTVVGAVVSGGVVTGVVEGVSPAVVEGEQPGAGVVIKMNGWIIDTPLLTWDEEEQAWVFDFEIPEDSKDVVISITVTNGASGGTSTKTLTVGA